jgi:hypothetical protein
MMPTDLLNRLSTKAPILGIDPTRGFIIGIAGNTVQMLGTYWDLWWHINIGRDTFWIPPHEVVLVGWAIVVFGNGLGFLADRKRQLSEGRPKFTLGYLLVGLGLGCMLIAAYLDDLRHRALALTGGHDTIITPTHLFLFASGFTVGLGMMFGIARELNTRGIWPKHDGDRLHPLRKITLGEAGLIVQFADWIMILTLLSWGVTDRPWSTGDWMAALLSSGIYSLVLVTALFTIRRVGTASIVAITFSVMRAPYQWSSFYYPFLILAAILLDLAVLRFTLTRSVMKTSLLAAFLTGPLLQTMYFTYAALLTGFIWRLQLEVIVVTVTLAVGVATAVAARPLSSIVRSITF